MHEIIFRLIRCLFTTVLLELFAGFFLGVREKRKLAIVALMNCATNPLVVFTLSLIPFLGIYAYSMVLLLFLEFFAFCVEGVVYKHVGFEKPFFTSLVLNAVSFFGDFLLRFLFTFI